MVRAARAAGVAKVRLRLAVSEGEALRGGATPRAGEAAPSEGASESEGEAASREGASESEGEAASSESEAPSESEGDAAVAVACPKELVLGAGGWSSGGGGFPSCRGPRATLERSLAAAIESNPGLTYGV